MTDIIKHDPSQPYPQHEGSYRRPKVDGDDPEYVRYWMNYITFEMAVRLGLAKRTGTSTVESHGPRGFDNTKMTEEEVVAETEASNARGENSVAAQVPFVIESFFADWDERAHRIESLEK